MANKEFMIEEGLPVTVYKRRGSRNLRLSVASSGQVRVTIPAWAPYKVGLEFARTRRDWIKSQQNPPDLLADGQLIGKAHRLELRPKVAATQVSGRLSGSTIIVSYPPAMLELSPEVQKTAKETSIRALRAQAETLLPHRLQTMAQTHGFSYTDVKIKRLKGRWGSCDQNRRIVLNLFLMQLPWELIDYVLLHELVHTQILRHGPDFWTKMKLLQPLTPELRKGIRQHRPVLNG